MSHLFDCSQRLNDIIGLGKSKVLREDEKLNGLCRNDAL